MYVRADYNVIYNVHSAFTPFLIFVHVHMYAFVRMHDMWINVCMWPRRKCRDLLCRYNKKFTVLIQNRVALCRYNTNLLC